MNVSAYVWSVLGLVLLVMSVLRVRLNARASTVATSRLRPLPLIIVTLASATAHTVGSVVHSRQVTMGAVTLAGMTTVMPTSGAFGLSSQLETSSGTSRAAAIKRV